MPGPNPTTLPATVYEIKVRGSLDESWSDWFSGMAIQTGKTDLSNRITILKGPVVDQSALRGILTRLWDMNYEIISFQRMPLQTGEEGKGE